jgi:hypothetical protein
MHFPLRLPTDHQNINRFSTTRNRSFLQSSPQPTNPSPQTPAHKPQPTNPSPQTPAHKPQSTNSQSTHSQPSRLSHHPPVPEATSLSIPRGHPIAGARPAAKDGSWFPDKPFTGPLESLGKVFASISSPNAPSPISSLARPPTHRGSQPESRSRDPQWGTHGADRGRRAGAMPVDRRGGRTSGWSDRWKSPSQPPSTSPSAKPGSTRLKTTRHSPPFRSQPQKLDILTNFRITRFPILAWGAMEPLPG